MPKCQKYGHPKDKYTRPPICGKLNHIELVCQNPFNCINCVLTGMWNVEKKKITEIKYTRNISFPKARQIEQTQEQPSYAYVTRKRNEEKEDTKQKQEELNKLINELKNLIEILKTVAKETIKEHISTIPNECKTHNQNQEKSPKQRKEKIQTKQKTLINEPIPLSNRFSPMDIEDSDETTTHIKTDTIKLQKRLNKKINTKTTQQKMK